MMFNNFDLYTPVVYLLGMPFFLNFRKLSTGTRTDLTQTFTMKRSYERLHYTNRLKILSAGALLAQTIFLSRLTAAYRNKKIPISQYRQWKHLFTEMYTGITNAPINNHIECAAQECRVKQLMDVALHIKFEDKQPWQGYQPLTANRLFPMPRRRSSLRRFQPYLISRPA